MRYLRNQLRDMLIRLRTVYLSRLWGHRLHPTVIISFGAYLDRTRPELIEIGERSIVTRGAIVLSHDYARATSRKVTIGRYCMIGVNSILLPGVTIGDSVIVGAGSVVTKDIESNSIAAGNPAVVIKRITTGPYGRMLSNESD